MPTSLKVILLVLVAIVLAVLARVIYLKQQTPAAPPVPMVQVRVSASDLPAGLLLRDDDLAWRSVPQDRVPARAITAANAPEWEGALLRHDVAADTLLTANHLLSPRSPGFLSAALRPGMRAVSIPVDDVSGNAGLIRPGDVVDLILTQDLRGRGGASASAPSVVSETVVEHARVIAVGSQLIADPSDGSSSRARTVTLELAPRGAEAVAVASRLGSLSLALRSFAVTDRERSPPGAAAVSAWQPESPSPVWASDVSRVISDMTSSTPAPPPTATRSAALTRLQPTPSPPTEVKILRGSQSATTVRSSALRDPSTTQQIETNRVSVDHSVSDSAQTLVDTMPNVPSFNNP